MLDVYRMEILLDIFYDDQTNSLNVEGPQTNSNLLLPMDEIFC